MYYSHAHKSRATQTSAARSSNSRSSATIASQNASSSSLKEDEVRLSPWSIARHVRSLFSLHTRKEESGQSPTFTPQELEAVRTDERRQLALIDELFNKLDVRTVNTHPTEEENTSLHRSIVPPTNNTKLSTSATQVASHNHDVVSVAFGDGGERVRLDYSFVVQCLRVRNFDVDAAFVSGYVVCWCLRSF
jgi:hypothetical protein